MSETFKAALVQLTAGPDIDANLERIEQLVGEASSVGAQFVCLPENCTQIQPDKDKSLAEADEEDGHRALARLAEMASARNIWLQVGSLTVKAAPKHCWNRSYLLNPDGAVIARYDKIHLFEATVGDGQTYRESDYTAPGSQAVVAGLPWGGLGLTICYDMRFPHLYRHLAKVGADYITVPSAFTRPTGRDHWEVLLRARAIETGCYVLAAAQCGRHAGGRETYGHSLIVDPWGGVLADGGEDEGIVVAEIDPSKVAGARARIPALEHDRPYGAASEEPDLPRSRAG
ncbi:MAG: carbon-nitrogen hydrolase family protein [Kiloniellales bacterium]